ncbi:hypothetical protein ccbrp13_18760 [Ktedonobacteria bacterium brp13]|nr:hypothetical protein ccbrp13_18760 [Ktedonobacteria bacterium brp13]
MQRLLLTSKGFANVAIEEAFLSLLPASPRDLKVALIPTASREMKGRHPSMLAVGERLRQMGFQAIDSIDVEAEDVTLLHGYDVLYFGGGNPFYLLHQL